MSSPGRAPQVPVLALVLLALVAAAGTSAAQEGVIVALGDSLTAGWGVAPDEAYPALLEARLRREGFAYQVINAGASGDTTAGGRRRLDWVLRSRPEIVIVALGANDGLRGQPVAEMQANLITIVERLRGAGAKVLLAGMRLPPNYGAYAREFAAAFPLAGRRATAFAPFLLDGVAADPRLNQADGIHPNAAGHRVMAERLWPYLLPLLRKDGRISAADPPWCLLVNNGRGASVLGGRKEGVLMRRLIACGVLAPLLLMTWTPPAHAGRSTDIALGLASFAVFNQIVAPLIHPRPAHAGYHRQEVVYKTVVTHPPVVYHPAPVVYAPPPVVAAPVSTVVYPHGRYELHLHGQQYVWVWIPTAPPPPPPPAAAPTPPPPPVQ